MNMKSVLSRVKKVFGNKKAFGFVDSGIKAIIAVVIGGVLLGGTYVLNHDVIMPTSTNRISSLFEGPTSEQSGSSSQTPSEPKAPADQSPDNKTIGIDNWGQPVNMDLWEVTKDGTNRVTLNDSLSSYNAGYLGQFMDGKIVGQIPARVKFEDETEFRTVASLKSTFQNCKGLMYAPTIPDIVTNLTSTFSGCTALQTGSAIPNGTTLMGSTFLDCVNLKHAPYIPSSVTNLASTFSNCKNLTGGLIIDANPTSIVNCLLGTSTASGAFLMLSGNPGMLHQIFATAAGNPHISMA